MCVNYLASSRWTFRRSSSKLTKSKKLYWSYSAKHDLSRLSRSTSPWFVRSAMSSKLMGLSGITIFPLTVKTLSFKHFSRSARTCKGDDFWANRAKLPFFYWVTSGWPPITRIWDVFVWAAPLILNNCLKSWVMESRSISPSPFCMTKMPCSGKILTTLHNEGRVTMGKQHFKFCGLLSNKPVPY